ncbi:MAG: hypothetical protein IT376_22165 [Polyangiaceae bacterium]|nr:hypothetical protein [Polyangiaceae bacterium]
MVVPAVVVVALVLAWRVFTRVERAGAAGAALALTGAVALAAWAPHWLKNLVWYGDPLYPTLHAWLPARPWSADAARLWAEVFLPTQLARPAPGAAGLRDAAAALATFAIVPNDYAGFHRSVPVFGFLFTALTLPAALLLGPERRLRLALAWCYVAIAAWYLTSHRDRYLQAIVPVMSAVTGAALVSLWRAPPAKRLRPLLIVLVGAQLVTSGDAYFLPTHALHRGASAGATMRLLGAGFQRNYAERFAVQTDLVALGASLPRGARVLLHESHDLLGTGARVSTDLPAEQAGIDYPSWGATARIARGLRELGFTHVAWRAGRIGGHLPVAADLLFLDLVRGLERSTTTAGAWRVAPLPAGEGADAGEEAWVDVHTCAGALHYPPGRYRVTDLSRSPLLRDAAPRTPRGPAGSGAPAGYLVIDRRCAAAVPTAGYARLGGRPERSAEPYELWRREGGSLP